MLSHLMAPTEDKICKRSSLGGHFSAIIDEHRFLPPGRYGYESARACLYALIVALQPKRVHIPNYICSAVSDALRHADCIVETYPIGDNFRPPRRIDLRGEDLVLLVNYFGLCGDLIEEHLEYLPRDAVVVDNSQAFFQEPFSCLANIYSPRKFIPVADGGFIDTEVPLSVKPPDEEASVRRFHYLLKRVGNEPESSREDYLAAEKSLEKPSLREMSALTRALIGAADHELIVRRRRENFRVLDGLARLNELEVDLGNQVPLNYPFSIENGKDIRETLIRMRIFAPGYWPGIVPQSTFERKLLSNTVFIPIDHRYDVSDIECVLDIVKRIVKT